MNVTQSIRKLFIGRQDVFAVETSEGFYPEHRAIADADIDAHVSGRKGCGFYLVDKHNRVWASCADFDNKLLSPDPLWQEKAEEVYFIFSRAGVCPPLVEVSQSGCAAHVWIFFSEPVPAWLPRAFWNALSPKLKKPLGEIYPRQDAVAEDGLGNLVRYPLWKQSHFADVENEWVVVDPIEAMAGVRRFDAAALKLLAFELGLGELKEPSGLSTPSLDGTALPARVARLVSRGHTLLGRRWAGDKEGLLDPSNSGLVMSISVELVRQYVPTPEIEAAVKYWCHANGAEAKGDRQDWVNRTIAKAYDFIASRVTEKQSRQTTTFKSAEMAHIDMIEKGLVSRIKTGIKDLDDSFGGVAPGEVCVIAARPSDGKSAFAMQWAEASAAAHIPALFCSEEMSDTEIGKRRLLAFSSVPEERWCAETVPQLRNDVNRFHADRSEVHLVLNCSTIDRIEEVIEQFSSIHGVGLVVVDYLQLLSARGGNRNEVVGEASRRIKQAAGRNKVAVLLLSQMSRRIEKDDEPGEFDPRLSDLRDSGAIEQDADIVLFTQWACRHDESADAEEYRVVCAKNRNGAINSPKMIIRFIAQKQTFLASEDAMIESIVPITAGDF